MNNNTIVILSQRMAGWLMGNGFVLLGIKKDMKNPNKHIFIFNDTELLRNTMAKYNEFRKFIAS